MAAQKLTIFWTGGGRQNSRVLEDRMLLPCGRVAAHAASCDSSLRLQLPQ